MVSGLGYRVGYGRMMKTGVVKSCKDWDCKFEMIKEHSLPAPLGTPLQQVEIQVQEHRRPLQKHSDSDGSERCRRSLL